MRAILILLIASLAGAVPGVAFAFTLGAPEVLSRQGEPLLLRVPLNMTANESGVRVSLAAESVYSALGYFYPLSLRAARIEIKDFEGRRIIEITGGSPRGDTMPVVMDITTSTGSVVRHFTVNLPEPMQTGGKTAAALSLPAKPAVASPQPKAGAATAAGSFAFQDMLIQQRIDQIKEAESDVAEKVGRLNDTVKGLVASIAISMEDTRRLQENINNRLEERFSRDDLTWFAGSAVVGFVMAMLIFGGRRRGLQAGMRVRLVGHGDHPIEGEFVRLVTDKSKPLPYRIADMMAGVPKTVEIRALQNKQHPQKAVQNTSAGGGLTLVEDAAPVHNGALTLEPIADQTAMRH